MLFGHPDIESLIAWHALEELEHKNVAFDVLDQADGRDPVRIAGFGVTIVALAGYVVLEWARAFAADRRHIGSAERRRFVRNLRRQRLLSPRTVQHALRYLRPGFHPDDMDTDGLVHEWRRRFADRTTVTAGMQQTASA